MSKRIMHLFDSSVYRNPSVKVASKEYEFTTLAYERQVADDLAKEHCIQFGHVAIVEDGNLIDKLRVGGCA